MALPDLQLPWLLEDRLVAALTPAEDERIVALFVQNLDRFLA